MAKVYEFAELECPRCGQTPFRTVAATKKDAAAMFLGGLTRGVGIGLTFFSDISAWYQSVTAKNGYVLYCAGCSKPSVACPYCLKLNIFLHFHQNCVHCGNDFR